jgi:hypothetical protein
MAGVFASSNTREQDEAVARAVAGAIRHRLEGLTRSQVMVVMHFIGYCPHCGEDRLPTDGSIAGCQCLANDQSDESWQGR